MDDSDAEAEGDKGASIGSQSSSFIHQSEPSLPERIGPYRILRKLGAGGMGAVYEGLNESIERRVAIKMLHARYSHDPETARRFINEARAVNRIDHPGVVQISDHGQLENGSAYIVMELLQGESLRTRIHRSRPLSSGESIDLGAQICEALAAAHARNIIHRDLKPDNIMIVSDRQMLTGERTKILDFGIAKLAQSGEPSSSNTQTNALLGTPCYMSPEQAQGSGKVEDKTDVYSLGVILYEMLAGKPPFSGEGLGELIVKHMSQPPPPLIEQAPSCPPELLSLVERLLEKDPAKRPTMLQCAELLDAMREQYPRPRPRPSQSLPLVTLMAGPEESGRASTMGRASGQALPHAPRRILAASLAVASLLAIAGTLYIMRRPASTTPSRPQQITAPFAVQPAATTPPSTPSPPTSGEKKPATLPANSGTDSVNAQAIDATKSTASKKTSRSGSKKKNPMKVHRGRQFLED